QRRENVAKALSTLEGQADLVQNLVRITARGQGASASDGPSILVLGGPSPSVLNRIVDLWAEAAFPNDPQPLRQQDLSAEMDGQSLGNDLFGANNGYKGSEFGSDLLYWVLEHPQGGFIQFSGIESTKPEVLLAVRKLLASGEVTFRAEFTKMLTE